tara:strand:+ start:622 stop:837 length:216 start_codon:yes stop_codon:yes gene_type:complete
MAQIQLIFPHLLPVPPCGKGRVLRLLLLQLGPRLLFFQLVLQSIILLHYFGRLGCLGLQVPALGQFYLADH